MIELYYRRLQLQMQVQLVPRYAQRFYQTFSPSLFESLRRIIDFNVFRVIN